MITFKDITKSYDGTTVLGPVSGQIAEREITSIIGPNGAGKSTLLTILGRLNDASTGTVEVDGLDVTTTPGAKLARKMAILRQENHLTARLRVRELVAMGRYPHCQGRLAAADWKAVDEALGFLDLTGLADRFLDQLSGGQRQRAFVAMVIAQDADYLLLDEPLSSLDLAHSVQMMALLRRVVDELGRTVVLVVHDLNFAATWSDSIIAMKHGQIAHHGPVAGLMNSETLSSIFETPIRVDQIDGQPMALPSTRPFCVTNRAHLVEG